MDDFFEYKAKIGAEVVRECTDKYFSNMQTRNFKFINETREILHIKPMSQEEYDELKKS